MEPGEHGDRVAVQWGRTCAESRSFLSCSCHNPALCHARTCTGERILSPCLCSDWCNTISFLSFLTCVGFTDSDAVASGRSARGLCPALVFHGNDDSDCIPFHCPPVQVSLGNGDLARTGDCAAALVWVKQSLIETIRTDTSKNNRSIERYNHTVRYGWLNQYLMEAPCPVRYALWRCPCTLRNFENTRELCLLHAFNEISEDCCLPSHLFRRGGGIVHSQRDLVSDGVCIAHKGVNTS